jgi:molybdate transport system substrate-binding protein
MIAKKNPGRSFNSVARLCGQAIAAFLCCSALAQELTVSAAASLTDAFKAIGQQFEKSNSGSKVTFNFAASDVLLRQIAEGAPVDVFASADVKAMDNAASLNAIDNSTRMVFAGNRLVFVLPSDSKLAVAALVDLQQPAVKQIAISQPAGVPVGRYAKAALDEAKLWSALEDKFIYTQNVRQSLDYVTRGEVDGGFVYATDAALLRDKVKVAFEIATSQPVVYPIAVTKRSKQSKLARQFVDLVKSPDGQKILADFGFAKP